MDCACADGVVVRHYRDLVCWQLANQVKIEVYAIIDKPSVAKDFKFCDQIRDSARSAPRNIAEGFGRYRPADFAHFLDFARGSLTETDNHVNDGEQRRYFTAEECSKLYSLIDRATAATTKLILYLRGPGKNH